MAPKNKSKVWKCGVVLVCGFIVAVVLSFGCLQEEAVNQSTSEKSPINVNLSISHAPAVNETTEVTCVVSGDWDLLNTIAEIILPEEATLISGNLAWNGDLQKDNPISFSATIMFEKTGNWVIKGVAKSIIDEENSWSDVDCIFLNVGVISGTLACEYPPGEETKVETSQVIPGDERPVSEVVEEFSGQIPEEPPSVRTGEVQSNLQAMSPGTLTVTGRWAFYHRGDVWTGANQFLVQLVTGGGSHLAWGYTDTSGYFTLGPVTNPGSDGVRVRIWTYVKYSPNNYELMTVVWGGDSRDDAYWGSTDKYVFSDGTHSVGTWEMVEASVDWRAKAFWIKDDLDRGFKYPPNQPDGGSIVEWPAPSGHGNHYHPGGHIHLEAGDADDTSDTVLHEMGHNVMWNIYGGYLPPVDYGPDGVHYFTRAEEPGCGWVEGWAHIWHMMVNNDPHRDYPGGGSIDAEAATWGTPGWDNGDTVEGRVAGAVWDIRDYVNDGYDQYGEGFSNIWDTVYNQNDDTFAQYWSAWKARGHNEVDAVYSIYQNTIDYLPELTVTSVTAPTSAEVGGHIAVSWTVKNQGNAASSSFHNRISLATTPYGTDISLGNFPMSSIAGGFSSSDAQFPKIPETVSPGYYYVTVFADAFDAVTESDENNNINKAPDQICVDGVWEDDPANPCRERRLRCSGTYEYRNANEGEVCDYGSWEDDPANPCKERRLVYKCSSGSCAADGYEYRNANEGEVCDYGLWEDDPGNPCKERRLLYKCSSGSCAADGYEYRNANEGEVCDYGPWEDDPANPCKERRLVYECSSGSCAADGYEYRNANEGEICDYGPWEDDPGNPCRERRLVYKCSSGSCAPNGYDYRIKEFTLTVASDGCCPISVEYNDFSDTVPPRGTQDFTNVPCGTVVSLSADDNDAYCDFVGWYVDGSSVSDNPILITMDSDHTAVATCEVPLPDLIVEDIWIEPAEFGPGDLVDVGCRIQNQGDVVAEAPFTTEFRLDGGYWWSVTDYMDLPAGGSREYLDDNLWPPDLESHQLRVIADAGGDVSESDEGNNERSEYFSAFCPTPGTPSNPSPINHATEASVNADLDWSDCSDTDYYDVYFGTSSPPPYYGEASESNAFLPTLDYNTPYYWQIVAKNNCGNSAAGPVWDFTTTTEPEPTEVSISPPSQEVACGHPFSVNVNVDPKVAIAGVQFSLSFNPSLLTANNVTEGNLLSQGGASTYFQEGIIDNVAGTITNVAGAIITPGASVSSPGTFATISFTAGTVEGTSVLDLSNVIVGNIAGEAVPITVTDGSVTIIDPNLFELEPSLALNVKGAIEEYTITYDGSPTLPAGVNITGWRVTSNWMSTPASIVDGGQPGDTWITVQATEQGEAHVFVDIDIDLDGIVDITLDAEKKWGEINCTELTSESLGDNEYSATELVKAAFIWGAPDVYEVFPAGDAVVRWWLMDVDALTDADNLNGGVGILDVEADLGDDPCDEDGGCGDWVWDPEYDPEDQPNNPFNRISWLQDLYPVDHMTAYLWDGPTDTTIDGDGDFATSMTDVAGIAYIGVYADSADGVLLVTLAEYPIDYHGENKECVQHETFGIADLNPHFVVDKIEAAVGEAVTFDPTSTIGGTLPYTRIRWDFEGDGVWDVDNSGSWTPATLPIATWSYDTEGEYHPCLEITDSSTPIPVVRADCMAPPYGITVYSAQVYLVPQDSSASFNETTDVEIWAKATAFQAGQMKLIYGPSCANVTNWERNEDDFPIGTWDSDTPGEEWITFSALGPLSGDYLIGTLTIHCISEEECATPLDFVEDGTTGSALFDDTGSEMPASWEDGTFECIPGVCGDVAPCPDCDGIINMGDVVLLLNYVGHPGEYELCCDWCGDVAPCPASDGIINMGDVVLLLNYVGHPGEYELCCE